MFLFFIMIQPVDLFILYEYNPLNIDTRKVYSTPRILINKYIYIYKQRYKDRLIMYHYWD